MVSFEQQLAENHSRKLFTAIKMSICHFFTVTQPFFYYKLCFTFPIWFFFLTYRSFNYTMLLETWGLDDFEFFLFLELFYDTILSTLSFRILGIIFWSIEYEIWVIESNTRFFRSINLISSIIEFRLIWNFVWPYFRYWLRN